jgi:hypothetical protein
MRRLLYVASPGTPFARGRSAVVDLVAVSESRDLSSETFSKSSSGTWASGTPADSQSCSGKSSDPEENIETRDSHAPEDLSPTLEEAIKSLEGESEHRSGETEHRSGETEHRSGETEHRSGETEHRSGETEHRSGETEHLKETDERLKETNVRLKETNERLKEANVRLKENNVRLQEDNVRLQEDNVRLQETNDRLVVERRRFVGVTEKLARRECANEKLIEKLRNSEARVEDLLYSRETAAVSLGVLTKEREAAVAEARDLRVLCDSLQEGLVDARQSEDAVRRERDELRVASVHNRPQRNRQSSDNARLCAKDLRDTKALLDAMQVRAAEAEALLAKERTEFQAQRVEMKRNLALALERNKSVEEKHAKNMAAALLMIDSVVKESQQRVGEIWSDARNVSCVAGKLRESIGIIRDENGNRAASPGPRICVSVSPGPRISGVPESSGSENNVEHTRAAGILLCIAVITQGTTDLGQCFADARRIPEALLTKTGAARRREAHEDGETSMRTLASLVERLCVASRGVLKVGRYIFCPKLITEMYMDILAAAKLELFDPQAMERLAGVVLDMNGAMRIGLHMAEAKNPCSAAVAVALPNPTLELAELMETAETFEDVSPEERDEDSFQVSMRKWQENLGRLVPWRDTARRAINLA